jgi:DNA-binding NarL/FixJ family response regulator
MARFRVVIVEEHDKVRREMAARLASEPDLELVGAVASGEEAVAIVQRGRPDVILLGLGMRAERGLEACRKIAAIAPEARILVLTSYEDEAEKREAYRAGACRYLLKDLEARATERSLSPPSTKKRTSREQAGAGRSHHYSPDRCRRPICFQPGSGEATPAV